MKTSEIDNLKTLRDLIICKSKFYSIILNELKRSYTHHIDFYESLEVELRCKNYYNSLELIDKFLFDNYNTQTNQSLFSENIISVYAININILKILLHIQDKNLNFYKCKIKEGFLIHFSEDKEYSILISINLCDKIKSNRKQGINIFINSSNTFNTKYIINIVENIKDETYYTYLLQTEQEAENKARNEYDCSPQFYGFSSWDEFAFNTAFEGNIDAWNEYDQ